MIEVQVREQDVHLAQVVALHLDTERPEAGARVEPQVLAAVELQLDAAGVAAIAHGVGSRRGERAAATPYAGTHYALPFRSSGGQNTVTTPCSSFCTPNNGYAVALTTRVSPSKQVASTTLCAGRRWKNARPAGES